MLDEAGEVLLEQKVGTTPKAMKISVRRDAAQSDRVGNGGAFTVREPAVERGGTRSDRGACAQRMPNAPMFR